MENQRFGSCYSQGYSPRPFQCFQDNRYIKNNNFSIPDTIPENFSAESNENSTRMEALNVSLDHSKEEDECTSSNSFVKSDESSASTILAVDNLSLLNFERKLLDRSSSDEERSFVSGNSSIKYNRLREIAGKLGLHNVTVSTPRSELKKEISILQNGMIEADEFHDKEIQVLREENVNMQLLEKYSELTELYTSLKNEYDEYRKEQEKLHYKTADCLDTLCSQIEASDSSLNFSNASFVSFNPDIKSSTIMGNISEVETTVVNDATFLEHDPLSVTKDGTFKTPTFVSMKSIKKLFSQQSDSTKKGQDINKDVEITMKQNVSTETNPDYNTQLLDMQSSLHEKVKEVEDLEQRLFKMEDLVSLLQTEHERKVSEFTKENKAIQDNLRNKTNQLNELTFKLFNETIGLNPSLEKSLVDAPGSKLLQVFIETILERGKELEKKFNNEKTEWESLKNGEIHKIEDLQNQLKTLNEELKNKTTDFEELEKLYGEVKKRLSEAEEIISTKDEKALLLQSQESNSDKIREDFALANKTIAELNSQLSSAKAEKEDINNRLLKSENDRVALEKEIAEKNNLLENFEKSVSTYLSSIASLQQSLQQTEELTTKLKADIVEKENNNNELIKEIEELKNNEKFKLDEAENERLQLQETINDLKKSLEVNEKNLKDFETLSSSQIQNNDQLNKLNQELEEVIENLKSEMELKDKKIEEMENEIKKFKDYEATKINLVESNIKELESRCFKLEETVLSYEKDAEIKKKTIQDLETLGSTQSNEIEELKKLMEQSPETIENLKSDILEKDSKINELIKEIEVLKNSENSRILTVEKEKAELENRCRELEKTLESAEKNIEEKNKIIQDLESLKSSLDNDNEELKKLIQLSEEAVLNLKSEISMKDKNAQELLNEIKELKSAENSKYTFIECKRSEIESTCLKLQETIFNLEKEMVDKKTVLEDLEIKISSYLNENENLKNLIHQSEETISNLKSEISLKDKHSDELLKELENVKTNESSKYNLVENEKKEAENRCSELEEKLLNVEKELNVKCNTLQQLEETLTSCQNENENLKKEIEEAENVIADVNAQNKNLENEKSEWESQHKNDMLIAEDHQSQIKLLNEKLTQQDLKLNELEELKMLNDELKNRISKAEGIISDQKEEICVLKEDSSKIDSLSELESQYSLIVSEKEIENRCRVLEENKTELQKSIDDHKNRIEELEKCISISLTENEELKKTMEKLEETIIQLKMETAQKEMNNLQLQKEVEILTNNSNSRLSVLVKLLTDAGQILLETLPTSKDETSESLFKIVSEKVEINSDASELLPIVIDTIIKYCENFSEKFDVIKGDWESQKKTDDSTIVNLKNMIQSLKEDLNDKVSELEDLNGLCTHLKTKIEDVENVVTLRDDTISKLESELLSIRRGKEEIDSKCEGLNEITEGLKKEIEEKNIILDELRHKCETEYLKKVEEEDDAEKKEAQLNEIREQCQKLEETVRILEKSSLTYTTENENLKKSVEELNEIIDDMKVEIDKRKQRENELEKEVEVVNSREASRMKILVNILNDTKNTLINVLPNCQDESNDSLYTLVSEKVEMNSDAQEILPIFIDILSNSIEYIKQDLNGKFENEKMEWESQRKADTTVIENLQRQVKCLSEIENQLISANDTVERLESQLSSIESEKRDIESRCNKLEENTNSLEKDINAKNSRLEELENSLTSYMNENEKLGNIIKESNEFIDNLRCEIEQKAQKTEELTQEIENINKVENSRFVSMENEKKKFESLCKDLEEITNKLENEIEIKKNVIDDLQKALSSFTEENETFKTTIKTNEEIISNLQADLKNLNEQWENEKSEKEVQKEEDIRLIDNLQNEVKSLKEQINSQEAKLMEYEELKKSYEDLKEELVAREEEIKMLQSQISRNRKTISEDLVSATGTITKLESQLSLAEEEKKEMKNRCDKLEETTFNLEEEMEVIKNLLEDWEKSVSVYSPERQMSHSFMEPRQKKVQDNKQKISVRLKMRMQLAGEEKIKKDTEVEQLQKEIKNLKSEKENIDNLTMKMKNLEDSKKNLTDILSDIQSCLDMPGDTMTKLLSGNFENKKIFSERINTLVKSELEDLKAENKNLKFGNVNLKEKVKELNKIIIETESQVVKEESIPLNNSLSQGVRLRSKSGKNMELYARRFDKLEEINQNLTDLVTDILTMTEFPNLEKLKLYSVRHYPNISKQIESHFKRLEAEMRELKEANAKLDEECDSYAKTIKDLKKEAIVEWKANREKTDALEKEISQLKEDKQRLENEKQDLLTKIAKLDSDFQKVKSNTNNEEAVHSCSCGSDVKKINEMKRIILIREQKIHELQDCKAQNTLYKSQIKYLENALDQEKKKISEEKEKYKKLQKELTDLSKNQKTEETKKPDENQVLNELRMCGSLSGGIVQDYVDKEKMRKLSKDISILKELCRARYAEIKRLEAENAALKKMTPKHSNQMDSPIRSKAYNTRSKGVTKETWRKIESDGKENDI